VHCRAVANHALIHRSNRTSIPTISKAQLLLSDMSGFCNASSFLFSCALTDRVYIAVILVYTFRTVIAMEGVATLSLLRVGHYHSHFGEIDEVFL
jgi:hypothetical protein